MLRLAQQPISLEKPVGEEDDSSLGDFVEDQTAESPFEQSPPSICGGRTCAARWPRCPTREREVIEMRFGLTGERPFTLEEVGRAFNVTRERIRQIENHTLKKLEALPEAQRLRDARSSAFSVRRRTYVCAWQSKRDPRGQGDQASSARSGSCQGALSSSVFTPRIRLHRAWGERPTRPGKTSTVFEGRWDVPSDTGGTELDGRQAA